MALLQGKLPFLPSASARFLESHQHINVNPDSTEMCYNNLYWLFKRNVQDGGNGRRLITCQVCWIQNGEDSRTKGQTRRNNISVQSEENKIHQRVKQSFYLSY